MVDVWGELYGLYDQLAARKLGKVGGRMFIQWGERLQNFSDDQLKKGLENCLKAESEYAPGLKVFISYCLNTQSGLTTKTAGYQEFRRERLLPSEIADPEVAKSAIENIRANFGKSLSQEEIQEQFNKSKTWG